MQNDTSQHHTGFIFCHKVPIAQMMAWQKGPLSSPLLTLNQTLKQDAVKFFKVIQHIMGGRKRDHPTGIPLHNGSTTSLLLCTSLSLLEEERWSIGEGLVHGELVFKGWQMLCILLTAFPPSRNFETYLHPFIHQHTSHLEGHVDVITKYCFGRLAVILKRGPHGKPPSLQKSKLLLNLSTFGESLDATLHLQEWNYPNEKIPVILPFHADGILVPGGTKCEGIFRVPGDSNLVSWLKLRIDRGYYTLENINDPHMLASLLKLWLRELCDPSRVVLFVVSFLQLFLEEKALARLKMTATNMALILSPNLLRCSPQSMTVVFMNAQFEQMFMYNLLNYVPPTSPKPRVSESCNQ
ncbi:Rho GTPase activation protein [Pisolithus marmoratus]|nr:Rho GTPase activation protein [Pisolithus marmoratus]